MSWTETRVVDERMRFVLAASEGLDSMSGLCRRFGISRRVGYKWLARYRSEGVCGLEDRPRTPHGNSRAVPAELVEPILAVRHRHPSWGPRKVLAWLEDRHPDRPWPAASTIGELLTRHGLTVRRTRRRRASGDCPPLGAVGVNEVCCIDFKGWFLTGDGTHVEPLTLTDAASRYLLVCQALCRGDGNHVWPVLERAFRQYGRPRRLRSDNGPPFAGVGAGGLTPFAVKVIKAGVLPERIPPGRPQHNGRHERMHLTLKQDTASPPARGLAEQMRRFDLFRHVYNEERPHEALGQTPPSEHYRPSSRSWDGCLRSPDYPAEVETRKVRHNGEIKWRGRHLYLSQALAGEPVGLECVAPETWVIKYGPIYLGTLKGKDKIRPGAR